MFKKIIKDLVEWWNKPSDLKNIDYGVKEFPATNIETTQELVKVLIAMGILDDEIMYHTDDIETYDLSSIINKKVK